MKRAKDLASQTQLKYRQSGQGSEAELAERDLKLELEEKELEAARKRGSAGHGQVDESRALLMAPPGALQRQPPVLVPNAADADDSDESAGGSDGDDGAWSRAAGQSLGLGRRPLALPCLAHPRPADGLSTSTLVRVPCADDEDDDDDDTAALLAELEKIKAQRAEEAARKAVERAQAEHVERAAELAGGNPLLNLGAGGGGSAPDFGVKRSWHEDSVFKHQARGEPPAKKQFVNDTTRSEFHRRFLNRYIK